MKVYLLTGARNVQVMFRASTSVSSDRFMIMVTESVSGATKDDVAKFENDRTGRLPKPAPGTENTPENQRIWVGFHRIVQDYIGRTAETNLLAQSYQKFFTERLEMQPLGEWTTARVFEFMKKDMATAAITSLAGPRIFELNPDLLDLLWEFDEIAASLVWGLPKWMNRKAYTRRERFHTACGRYLESAWANFDPYGPDADVDWEPNFGARFMRELAKWMKERDFSLRTCAGTIATTGIFGYFLLHFCSPSGTTYQANPFLQAKLKHYPGGHLVRHGSGKGPRTVESDTKGSRDGVRNRSGHIESHHRSTDDVVIAAPTVCLCRGLTPARFDQHHP
jgi:hypothetical protein